MDISIVVCTYNRADSLRQTLASFSRLHVQAATDWELLVIDNNSHDHTPGVCREFSEILPIRYLQEKRQGLALARNHGIRQARGGVIAFTDDDVDVDPAWMAELCRASHAHPEAGMFGGKIVPLWSENPPAWLAQYSQRILAGITMDFTLGEEELEIESGKVFFGANMAFRREAIQTIGLFREDLGMNGSTLGVHEETEYMERLLAAGCRGIYLPKMEVYHRNPAFRMTERYMLRWFAGHGECDVRLGNVPSSPVFLFGAPRYLWRQLGERAFAYLSRRWNPSAGTTWVPAARAMAILWGNIREFRRMTMERKHGPPKH